jgi:hypothetical protein
MKLISTHVKVTVAKPLHPALKESTETQRLRAYHEQAKAYSESFFRHCEAQRCT